MLRIVLEQEGYEIRTAKNGLRGLQSLRERVTDLVVTDLLMPEMEGIETILELRRDFPRVKIIATSGGGLLGPEDYLDSARQPGAHLTFVKPLILPESLDGIRETPGLSL